MTAAVEILDAAGRPIKSAADVSDEARGVLGGLVTGTRPPRRGSYELLAAYTEIPMLRQVVHRVCESLAATEWVAYRTKRGGRSRRDIRLQVAHGAAFHKRVEVLRQRDELEELENDLLVQFLADGNPMLSGFESQQVLFTHLELVGEAAAWIERNRLGVPVHYWPLVPTWVRDVPGPGQSSFEVEIGGRRLTIDARDILYFRDPDPLFPYSRGSGIAGSLGDELDTLEYASRFLKAFFYNDATPSAVVSIDQATNEQMRGVERSWMEKHQGAAKGYRVHFLNRKVEVTELTRSLKDLTILELQKLTRDIVRETWGVPPEVFGLVSNSNRATIRSASYLMALFVLLPRLSRFRAALQTQLVPQFDERKVVGYVSPVPEDEERMLEAARIAPWALSRAEWREWMGKGSNGDADEAYLQPFGLLERPVDGPRPSPPVFGASVDGGPVFVPQPTARPKAIKAAVVGLGDVEQIVEAVQPEWLTEQVDELWSDEFRAWANRILSELGVDVSFNMLNPVVVEHLRRFGGERIAFVNDTTRESLRAQLVEAVRAGEGWRELSARIGHVFEEARGWRSVLIARTETSISANFATWQAHRQSGVVAKREWISTSDGRSRDMHLAMGGVVVGIEQPFQFPDGVTTMAPGQSGVAHHDCNCRCTTVAVINDATLSVSAREALHKVFDDDLVTWEGRAQLALRRGFARQWDEVEAVVREIAARRGEALA